MSALCTPEYNEETKRLRDQRDELSRLAEGAKSGDFGKAIRAKAKEFAAKGETDAGSIRDQVHDWINQYAPHTHREVADIISGYGRERAETKDALQKRLNSIRAELRQGSKKEDIASGKIDPEAEKRTMRASALRNEIAKLDERLKNNRGLDTTKRQPISSPEIEQLRARREELRKELLQQTNPPAPTGPKDLMGQKNETRQKMLRKEMDRLRSRIANKDFETPQKNKPLYNDETLKLERERELLKKQFQNLLRRQEARNQAPWKKTLDVLHNVHMMSILSSINVFPKLMAAVLARYVGTPLEGATVSLARSIPGLRKWADIAPRHGAGLNLQAEKLANTTGIKAAFRGAIDNLKYGQSKHDQVFGKKDEMSQEYVHFFSGIAQAIKEGDYMEAAKIISSLPGRTHGAVKEFASQPEFYRSFYLRDQHMRAQLTKAGKSQADINEFMNRETTKATIGAKAYLDSLEAKLQGPNAFAEKINGFIYRLDKGSPGEKMLAFTLRSIFPIRKIPLNIAKEATSYLFGGIKALTRMKGDFNEQNAEYIMKNIGKQGAGAVLLGIGFLGGNAMFGGLVKDKRGKDELKTGEGNVGGVHLGTEAFHGPAAQAIQFGAGLRAVYDKEYKHSHDAIAAGLNALGSNAWALTREDVPYVDQPIRMNESAQRAERYQHRSGAGAVLGNQLRSMIVPQAIQQIAVKNDSFPGYRQPGNITQDIEMGIPGLRENVPKEKGGKLRPK